MYMHTCTLHNMRIHINYACSVYLHTEIHTKMCARRHHRKVAGLDTQDKQARTYIHTYKYTYIYLYIYAHTHTYIHTHTHTRT